MEGGKIRQGYDEDPPRCFTCVYFKREPARPSVTRKVIGRQGKETLLVIPLKKHPQRNPLIDRCTFGNFQIKPQAVCDEWHSRTGERLE